MAAPGCSTRGGCPLWCGCGRRGAHPAPTAPLGEWFGWEGTFQIIPEHLPYPRLLQPGLKEAALMDLADHILQREAREDYPRDQPPEDGQDLGSTSSELLVHPGIPERTHNGISSQHKQFQKAARALLNLQICFPGSALGRSWRGNAAGWDVAVEQREESVPSAGCSDPAAPKRTGWTGTAGSCPLHVTA